MESTDQHLAKIDQRLTRIERTLSAIARENNAKNKLEDWLPEKEAAAMLHWSVRWLRQQYSSGKIAVQRKDFRGRNFYYSRLDIERLLLSGF